MDRITTGVAGLDEAMGGGLLKGATVLVVGPPGAGKTVLTNQIAFHRVSQGKSALNQTTAPGGVTKLVASLDGLATSNQMRSAGGSRCIASMHSSPKGGSMPCYRTPAGTSGSRASSWWCWTR